MSGFAASQATTASVDALRRLYYGAPIVLILLQMLIISFWRMDSLHARIRDEQPER